MTRRELMKLAAAMPISTATPQDARPLNVCIANTLLNYNEQLRPHEPSGMRQVGDPVCKWCSCPYWGGK